MISIIMLYIFQIGSAFLLILNIVLGFCLILDWTYNIVPEDLILIITHLSAINIICAKFNLYLQTVEWIVMIYIIHTQKEMSLAEIMYIQSNSTEMSKKFKRREKVFLFVLSLTLCILFGY